MKTVFIAILLTGLAGAQAQGPTPDITKTPTLYVVPYAHLDTEWNWDYVTTIKEYLPKTMTINFDFFEKYPHYIFNFSGANRYRMIKEYYPADFARIKKYVDAGRWYPAGSSMEEGDVNAPSAEAIIRQVLYGNNWFRKEFGKASAEFMLPDCFGFPASLPSILAHAGIKGFSTQKLSSGWQPAPRVGGPNSPEQTPEGIPFNVGIWKGPDGQRILAALNPGSYTSRITYDLSKTPPPPPTAGPGGRRGGPPPVDWTSRIDLDGKVTGLFADYHYIGTGDIGGAVDEGSVKLLEETVTKSDGKGDGPVHVVSSQADQMFLDVLKTGKLDRLPQVEGDLELINHSAGSLTSQAYLKRWNRKNELLADAAEKASVAADWLGGRPYPRERLNEAWSLVMAGHFHDIMAGTAMPKAYEYAWNDQVIAMNEFAGVLTSATEAVASTLNTQAKGVPIVVYNPLNVAREDVVEAQMSLPGGTAAVRVTGPDGREVPSQVSNRRVLFLAKAPSVGYAVYDVEPASSSASSALKVTESSLENARYRVQLDPNGDVSSIFDKQLGKELLSAPIRLGFQYEKPRQWPAWNMDWEDQQKPPRGYVQGAASVRIVENGPVRVALEVSRETEGSKFVQVIRLSAGDAGNRVEFADSIDWKVGETALKAIIPLSAANPEATYNWDIGTVRRHNDEERQFEVASHQWVDLTDKSGAYGVTLLTDCKNGSDKPDDNTLRLTLIYSPGVRDSYTYMASNDWGHHEILYGLAGHAGDWSHGQTDWQAHRLNQPLIAFEATKHPGAGRELSVLKLSNSRVRVLAMKKAEQSEEVIIRLVELDGKSAPDVRVSFPGQVTAAREVNGQEQPVGPANIKAGSLVANFAPYQPRTFALKLAPARTKTSAPKFETVSLSYDFSAGSRDGEKSAPGFDSLGRALPAEILPEAIDYDGVRFRLSAAKAVVAKGQAVPLPAGKFNRIYILAAADGDQKATFRAGDQSADLQIQNWTGHIGQWDNREWKESVIQLPPRQLPPNIQPGSPEATQFQERERQNPRVRKERFGEMTGIAPGFIKRAPVAWFASHHHTAEGANEPYQYCYLFAYAMDAPANARTLNLPTNDKIRILAITTATEPEKVRPVQPLYDVLGAQ